jgi:hypothetical protein
MSGNDSGTVSRQGKKKHSEETCPSAALSSTSPILRDVGTNQGRRGVVPATNGLSYGTTAVTYNGRC